MNNLNRFNWIIGVIILISAFSIVYYFYHFSDYGISTQTQDWSNFGGFISPILTFLTMALMIYTIKDIHKREADKQKIIKTKEQENFDREKMRLLLDILLKYKTNFTNSNQLLQQRKQHQDLTNRKSNNHNNQRLLDEEIELSASYIKDGHTLKFEVTVKEELLLMEIYNLVELYFKNRIGAIAISYVKIMHNAYLKGEPLSLEEIRPFTKLYKDFTLDELFKIIKSNRINTIADVDEFEKTILEYYKNANSIIDDKYL